MTLVFLYGTLRHPPLLRAVAGKDLPSRSATLAGHMVRHAGDAEYPQIFVDPDAQATGLLVDADTEALAAFDYYEGAYGYALRQITVDTDNGPLDAHVYWPPEGTPPGAPWDLKTWVLTWADMTVSAVPDILRLRSDWTAEQSCDIRPYALARGWARQLAKHHAPATLRHDPVPGDVQLSQKDGGYMGFFGLRRIALTYRQFDGAMSQQLHREVFMGFDVALVLPYDPVLDQVLLVEQLRFGPLLRGDARPWVLEPIAGLIDAGEAPEVTALRETREEANLNIDRLVPINQSYPSPGYTTEYFHSFVGIANLADRQTKLGGLAEESEDIRSHVMPRSKALQLADSGEITAMPLVMMLYWLERHHSALRRA